MVVIFSEKTDVSTNDVIDWLISYNVDFFRYNDPINLREKEVSAYFGGGDELKIKVEIKDELVEITAKINSIWFRRPYTGIGEFSENNFGDVTIKDLPEEETIRKLKSHYLNLKNFLIDSIGAKKKLGSYHKTGVNKLEVLVKAEKEGINIPPTLVTNSRKEVINFLNGHKKIITKPLHESVRHVPKDKNFWFSNKTTLITSEEDVPEIFGNSLFQGYVSKLYELRIFYLDGRFFAACIFSQRNPKTRIDFRNYDNDRPNRIVPYNLPVQIQTNLHNLMIKIGLNTGSIDMIKSRDGRYYFLEVNPVGQFGFISYPCNFNIEREIAKYLIDYE